MPVNTFQKKTYQWPQKTIMVAEDEEVNYMLLERILTRTQVNLIWAIDGKEAVELYESNSQIDLILMDIKMPILDGYEAVGIIRKSGAKIPIIAQTAYAMGEEARDILDAGFNDYITKPISISELFSTIDKYLSLSA